MKAAGKDPQFPSVEHYENLLEHLSEVGPVATTGMGIAPISFQEIEAWQRCTEVQLSGWEASTLRDLSVTYVEQYNRSESPNCPEPYQREIDREAVASSMHEQMQRINQQIGERRGARPG